MTAYGQRCSTIARALAEPLPGTAPLAQTWVALEQPGPWGHRALTESHLDAELGAEITARQEGTGVTVVLIRRPGPHPDAGHLPAQRRRPDAQPSTEARALWIGYTGPSPWLVRTTVADPSVLLHLDLPALAAGIRPTFGDEDAEPLLLVCTNSRRDECCALVGRPLAARLAESRPGRVWESTHLGGHRLAPVVLSLPDGFVYGGPDAGSLGLAAARGRSSLPRPGQAAELAALATSHDPRPRALSVVPEADDWLVTDPLVGDRPVRYAVEAVQNAPERKESCKKGPVSSVTYRAERIDA